MECNKMMGKIKNLISTRFQTLFDHAMSEYIKRDEIRRNKHLNSQALIGHETRIFSEGKLYNNSGKRDNLSIGDYCDIRGELLTFGHGGEISIGDYCFVGANSKIWSAKKIVIGNRVLISHNVNIHDNNSHPTDSASRHDDFKHIRSAGFKKTNNLNEKEVYIGDDVWVGFNATILKGVRIGNGAIIGSNTVVTTDVPDYAVCIGNPMRIIKYTV